MITIVEGRPGQGKTLYAVDRVILALKNKRTFVASNIALDFKENDPRLARFKLLSLSNTIEDIMSLDLKRLFGPCGFTRILLVIDEVQTIMNSRRWADLPPEFEFFLQQHRHYRFDIIGLTQSIKRADGVMRELVQFFTRIEKIATFTIPFLGSFGFFFLWHYDPDSIESSTKSYLSTSPLGLPTVFFATPYTMGMYDTHQIFPILKREGTREIIEYVHQPVTELKKVEVKRTKVDPNAAH